jgi:hypothetical protein
MAAIMQRAQIARRHRSAAARAVAGWAKRNASIHRFVRWCAGISGMPTYSRIMCWQSLEQTAVTACQSLFRMMAAGLHQIVASTPPPTPQKPFSLADAPVINDVRPKRLKDQGPQN